MPAWTELHRRASCSCLLAFLESRVAVTSSQKHIARERSARNLHTIEVLKVLPWTRISALFYQRHHVRIIRARKVLTDVQFLTLSHILTSSVLQRQNNDALSALSAKVTQLRSVTVDIYDNARDQGIIDSTNETFSNMLTGVQGSARRLGTMAAQGNKVAVLKLAGIIVGVVVVLWWLLSWFW